MSDHVPSTDTDMQRAGVRDAACLDAAANTDAKRQLTAADHTKSVAINVEQSLRDENKRLREELQAATQARVELSAQLEASRQQVAASVERMEQMESCLAAGRQQFEALQATVAKLVAERERDMPSAEPGTHTDASDAKRASASGTKQRPAQSYVAVATGAAPAATKPTATPGPHKTQHGAHKKAARGPSKTPQDPAKAPKGPERAPRRPQGSRAPPTQEELLAKLARMNNVILRGVKGCAVRETNTVARQLLTAEGVDLPRGVRFIRLGGAVRASADSVCEGPVKALCNDPRAAIELIRQVELHCEGSIKAHADLSVQERADKAARRRMNDVWDAYKAEGCTLTWVDGTQLFYWKEGARDWAPALPNPPTAPTAA